MNPGPGLSSAGRRTGSKLAAAMIVILASGSAGAQQAWRPERTVELVVPAAAGGAIDATARLIQRILQSQRIVEVPIITVNKGGGGGNLGLSYLDQHPADPHYLFNSTMSLMTNHIQGLSKTTYTDYTPVAVLYGEYMVFVVRPDSPIKTGRDVIEKLRRDPASMSMAIGVSLVGTNNLALALVTRAAGIDPKKLKTVVFQSNSQSMTALMGGHVDLGTLSVGTALSAAQQGRVRIIGITSERRGDGPLAQTPTWKEQGVDVVFTNTRFIVGPKGMTGAHTAFWDAALERVVQTDEWKGEVDKNHWAHDYLNSRQSPQRLAEMYKQLKGALADAGLSKE